MKIKKGKCYVVGYIDKTDGNYYLDPNLEPCFTEEQVCDSIAGTSKNLEGAYDWFLLESTSERYIKDGNRYYYLCDTFGDGLIDHEIYNGTHTKINNHIFTKKSFLKRKKAFNNYYDVTDNDARCIFKIVPITVDITETKKLVEITETHVTLK